MITKELINCIVEASYWKIQYKACDPDIGWGPLTSTIVDDICKEINVTLNDNDRANVINLVNAKK